MSRADWLIDWGCDWLQLRTPSGFNWLTFHLLRLECEWERQLGTVEASVALLGFHLRIAYVYDHETPFRKELMMDANDWLSETAVYLPHDEYVALKADAEKWRGVPTESLGREA